MFLLADVGAEDESGVAFWVFLEVKRDADYFEFVIADVGNVLHNLKSLVFILIGLFVAFHGCTDHLVEVIFEQTCSFGTMDASVVNIIEILYFLFNAHIARPRHPGAIMVFALFFLDEFLKDSITSVYLFVSAEASETEFI